MLTVSCPECDRKMRAPEEYVGKTAKCGSCGHKFVIDGTPAPVVELAPVEPPPRPSAPPPFAAEKQWHFAVDGVRKGPISFAQMSSLVASGGVGPRTLVWCEGMDDWKEASQTALMNSATPPPLNGQYVPNGMVWVLSVLPLAFLPLVFLAISDARTVDRAIENMFVVVMLFLFISFAFFAMDYIRACVGRDTTSRSGYGCFPFPFIYSCALPRFDSRLTMPMRGSWESHCGCCRVYP
jgi:hypothetical protein